MLPLTDKKIYPFSVDEVRYPCNAVFETRSFFITTALLEWSPVLNWFEKWKIESDRRWGSMTKCSGVTDSKSVTKLLRYGITSGGVPIKLMQSSNVISRKIFSTNFLFIKMAYCKEKTTGNSLVTFHVLLLTSTFGSLLLNLSSAIHNYRTQLGRYWILIKEYVQTQKKNSIPPRRMLMSSFYATNGTLITFSLLFYLMLGMARAGKVIVDSLPCQKFSKPS